MKNGDNNANNELYYQHVVQI